MQDPPEVKEIINEKKQRTTSQWITKCPDSQYNGYGKLYMSNGDFYEGEFIEGYSKFKRKFQFFLYKVKIKLQAFLQNKKFHNFV